MREARAAALFLAVLVGVAGCGHSRWPAKVLADGVAIHATPINTSIDRLRSLPRPAGVDSLDAPRVAAERQVYRVRAVLQRSGSQLDAGSEQRIRAYLAAKPRDRHGRHDYDFADTGLDPDETRARFTPHSEEFDVGAIHGGYQEIGYLWDLAQATERKRVLPEEAIVNSEVVVEASAESIYKRLLEPKVMERYLISDDVEAVAGARGEDLGAEFHCHHGGSVVSMRVVNLEPGRELTLIADQPTTMYITTRLSEEGEGRTKVARSFLWEEPQDPDVAQSLRQVMEFTAAAGEAAIKSAFEQPA